MITTTHVLANTWLAARGGPGVDRATRRWFVVGGLAPDVPLYLLGAGSLAWYGVTQDLAPSESFAHVFDTMFFEHPFWKAANSLFHAPLVLLATWLVGRRLRGHRGTHLRAFAVGATIHAVVDVLTHHSDGPLLFFPLDWTYRFMSPVSYYEPDHFGRPMTVLDLGLTIGLASWALLRWRRDRDVLGGDGGDVTPRSAILDGDPDEERRR